VAQLKAGRLLHAIASLEAALKKRPGDTDPMYYLGRASGSLSKETFGELQAAQPASARANQVMGETYSVLKNIPGGEKEFREALRSRADVRGVHLELGELYASTSMGEGESRVSH
jgi:hypothetical protein